MSFSNIQNLKKIKYFASGKTCCKTYNFMLLILHPCKITWPQEWVVARNWFVEVERGEMDGVRALGNQCQKLHFTPVWGFSVWHFPKVIMVSGLKKDCAYVDLRKPASSVPIGVGLNSLIWYLASICRTGDRGYFLGFWHFAEREAENDGSVNEEKNLWCSSSAPNPQQTSRKHYLPRECGWKTYYVQRETKGNV